MSIAGITPCLFLVSPENRMASRTSRKRSRSKRSTKRKATSHINVHSMKDIAKLMRMVHNNTFVLAVVTAGWCGHCKHYKEGVWNPMTKMLGRKMPMAEVNETVYRKTPLGAANVSGYPTVILLKKGVPHTEIKDAKNVPMMNKLVMSTPEEIEKELPSSNIQSMSATNEEMPETEAEAEAETEQETETEPVPNFKSEEERSAQSAEIVRNSQANVSIPEASAEGNTIASPPNASDDLIRNTGEMLTPQPNATMVENVSSNTASNMNVNMAAKPKVGGSLYASLLKAAAPAVILTGAVAMSRRYRKHHAKTRRARRV